MIDLHTHTFLSDGALGPAEHIRRAEVAGYRILGFADHADLATMETILPQLQIAARRETARGQMLVLAGIELTHMRPEEIGEGAAKARDLGAAFVIVHGETLAEPVQQGTNRAAIEAGADILAHPGLIAPEEVALAAERNVRLEISAKPGHCLGNGHVAKLAAEHGAQLIFGSDAHGPSQMPSRRFAESVCSGAGLDSEQISQMFEYAEAWARSL
ncbi:MAG: histidinol phosphate phosphatase domain-containing protein [Phycisphaerae bacterium]